MVSQYTFLWAAIAVGIVAMATSHAIAHEKRNIYAASAIGRGQRIDAHSIIPVRIGLTQSDLDDGYAHLMDIASPTSPNYGKHWAADAVNAVFSPSNETGSSVREWLVASGIDNDEVVEGGKGWLTLNIPASKAERLFNTEYYEYETADGAVRMRCDEYHLPAHISGHFDYIGPGVALSQPLTKKSMKRNRSLSRRDTHEHKRERWNSSSDDRYHAGPWSVPPHLLQLPDDLRYCSVNMTPTCIRALYNIPQGYRNDSVNMLGIYENSELSDYVQEDLDLFFEEYAPYVPKGSHPVLNSVYNGTAPVALNSSVRKSEADIDLDLAFALTYPQVIGSHFMQIGARLILAIDCGPLPGRYCPKRDPPRLR